MERKIDSKTYPVSASEYTVLEEVGHGASAIVYKANCIPFNEIVAIKVLDLEKCNSNLDDIRREVQTMRLINHPNVLRAHCSFVVEQSLWVVMPYMAGGSCLHIMKSAYPDGFDEPVITTILRDCLKALEYLHSHGHIHRDVKAGNILVDSNGAVKLGDFGVSACMFDTGDRQRSRNTFVGTPCWMAPEVMEQLHGYDFKADIWSFGITALEFAHGHAPFSKYPPMKVLLMTLQNAPPGLDSERDKRFTKSFKEMVAMCLVKNPAKRPAAEKLLRHSFFKRARSNEYIAHTVLDGLPPLSERLRDLKMKDADRLAQKQMPSGEKEERSQSEYKRGVSAWNFDLEDLKAQASLIQDDDERQGGKENLDQLKPRHSVEEIYNPQEITCQPQSVLLQGVNQGGSDDFQLLNTIHDLRAESITGAGEHVTTVRSSPLLAPDHLSSADTPKGFLNVLEDGTNADISICNQNIFSQHRLGLGEQIQLLETESIEELRKEDRFLQKLEERNYRVERMQQDGCCASSVPLVPEYLLASHRRQDEERDQGRKIARGEDAFRGSSHYQEQTFSGPLIAYGPPLDYRFPNGVPEALKSLSGTKEASENGLYVQKKGRFSVTSENVDLMKASTHNSYSASLVSSSGTSGSAAVILPHLQNILQQATTQQVLISNLMNSISQGETHALLSNSGSKCFSRSPSRGVGDHLMDVSSDRERELLQQVSDLQNRLANLVDELQTIKLRNISLERQLNTICNKEEEKRIRREELSRDER